MTTDGQVKSHYGHSALGDRIVQALDAAGLGSGTLSPGDLAPLDQFHVRGLAATAELAIASGVGAATRVLDVGSGLGGPSRYLAAHFGCHVTGIDLSESFVDAATLLAERTGQSAHVRYQQGDALALPYPDGMFDLVWTQHVAMNIADRAGLYREIRRVLAPKGRLAIYDVVAGEAGEVMFPVPWARSPETSFLLSAPQMRRVLEAAGFTVIAWHDKTEAGIAWYAEQRLAAKPQKLGLSVAMGPDFPTLAANLGRNLSERRVGLVEAVLEAAQR